MKKWTWDEKFMATCFVAVMLIVAALFLPIIFDDDPWDRKTHRDWHIEQGHFDEH